MFPGFCQPQANECKTSMISNSWFSIAISQPPGYFQQSGYSCLIFKFRKSPLAFSYSSFIKLVFNSYTTLKPCLCHSQTPQIWWVGWIPRKFKIGSFKHIVGIFLRKIIKMITRMNLRIFTNSPYIWFLKMAVSVQIF